MQQRPDPDALLAHVQATESRQQRGRLTIFFGASPGVGKTYAMLEAARARQAEQIDVVVGVVETHGRAETEALLAGLEVLPRQSITYRNVILSEFDLDRALTRQPGLLLVDELAHSNAPGSRHPKRWQDVEELLAAGVSVYTTINVQHIESLNDIVAQITGVVVRETVPDHLLEQADEVVLIDLPPDELLQRLREGKVYMPHYAERALRSFFRKGNLIALRELALRRTADRVDAQMEDYRRSHAITQPWPAALRLLVGISAGPGGPRLVRAARRMAAGLRAEWIVAYVETPADLRGGERERSQITQTLRLAEQLGAETTVLSGTNAADELLAYARSRNISKIVIGKPERARWQDLLFGSVADDLLRKSSVIDLYVLSGDFGDTDPPLAVQLRTSSHRREYLWSIAVVLFCTLLAYLMVPYFAEANIIMVYLLGVVGMAMRGGRGPAILASFLGVLAFDFFYVLPYLTFAVSDTQYLITFGVMLLVGIVISTLTGQLRQQAQTARQREQRTAALYALSRELASTRGSANLVQIVERHIASTFDCEVVLLRRDNQQEIAAWPYEDADSSRFMPSTAELGIARWVADHGQMAGLGTNTLPSAESVFLPLSSSQHILGVVGVRPRQAERLLDPEQRHLLEAFINQAALALERANLADEAQRAHLDAEAERLRSALLSSVSHDLRTPLAVITGSLSSLLQSGERLDRTTRDELTRTAYSESERLNRLVGNLLHMTRLEAGVVQPQREWQPLDEVISAVVTRITPQLEDPQQLTLALAPDLPLLALDSVLIEQVLLNLVDNALTHTPAGTAIAIRAEASDSEIIISVADRGPGLGPVDPEQLFHKFHQGQPQHKSGHVGLGLAICRGMVTVHGGRIWAANREGGGAIFAFSLPLLSPPDLPILSGFEENNP